MTTTLTIENLRVLYPGPRPVRAVDGVSLQVSPGECLGIVGESGSGKSTLARAALGLIPDGHITGSLRLGDLSLDDLDEDGWRSVRWCRVALVFQATTALNPVLRIGEQIAEPMRVHLGVSRAEASQRAGASLARVGLDAGLDRRYPHELSGGQRRLVLIAMALACDPEVLILDEPTSGLDPMTRLHVLELLRELRADGTLSLLVLTHDVDALSELADRVMVMYRGWLAEVGPAGLVLDEPRHPYTWGLLNARPTLGTVKDLRGIRGDPPDPTSVATGCPFAERCTQVVDDCIVGRPPLQAPTGEDGDRRVSCVRGGLVAVLRARGLHLSYTVADGMLRRRRIPAVDGVDIEVREAEVVAVVGPNGAGKSTLGQLVVRMLEPDGGTVELEGMDLLAARGSALKQARRRAQMLFQDPFEALSPRLTVAETVREPLEVQDLGTPAERDRAVRQVLTDVRLPIDNGFGGRRTHQLSGGQLQRVALARALVLEPKLLVADEPLAGLDPSEQAKMLQLLKALQVERGMAMILVSHDLATVLRAADRVIVLDHGRVVEESTGDRLLHAPRHHVTRALLRAAGHDPAAQLPAEDEFTFRSTEETLR